MKIQQIKQTLIDQQQEAQDIINDSQLIEREQLTLITESINSKLITVIVGIRRSGKSTLAMQSHKNKKFLYFNFDDEILAQIKTEELQDLLNIGLELKPDSTHLIFDEIQNIPKWELFINKLQRKKFKITLTGSNSRLLSSELASHLTGRHVSIEVLPLSFAETLKLLADDKTTKTTNLNSKKIIDLQLKFKYYIENGGFPEVYSLSENKKFRHMYAQELYDKILTRDIVQRRKIKNIKALKEVALLCLFNFSSRFSYQVTKRTSQINSLNTVKNYIDYLEESYLGFVIEPFSFKVKERISLPKKFYCIDPLILSAILKNENSDFGKKLENIIFLELRRMQKETYCIIDPKYEVDFAIREGRSITELIQVCWDLSEAETKAREIKSLLLAQKKYNAKKLKIITYATEDKIQIDESFVIEVTPAWKWLLTNSE